jgi:hypothetical protein
VGRFCYPPAHMGYGRISSPNSGRADSRIGKRVKNGMIPFILQVAPFNSQSRPLKHEDLKREIPPPLCATQVW